MVCDRFYFFSLFAIALLITLYRILVLYTNGLDLFFDEAQYWYWAKHLAFGYYSKPPMVAWVIAATTGICGDLEPCIRIGSPILHALTGLLIYGIGTVLYSSRVGFYSGLVYLTLPAVSASSLVISTDSVFLFCWAAALFSFVKAVRKPNSNWWWGVGVAAGFGMLSKYTMVLFLPSALFACYRISEYRPCFHEKKAWMAIALAILIFIPNVIWNMSHGFVSVLHTKDNANLDGDLLNPFSLLEFIGGQFLVFGPLLFAILVWLFMRYKQAIEREIPAHMLAWFVMPFMAVILVVSFLSRAHINWAGPVYVAATILVVAWLSHHNMRKLIWASVVLHMVIAVAACHYDQWVKIAGWDIGTEMSIHKKTVRDPFSRFRGQYELADKISRIGEQYPDAVLMADDRKTVAALSYYLPRIYGVYGAPQLTKWNPGNHPKDHYDMVMNFKKSPFHNALLVTPELISETTPESVLTYFSEVHILSPVTIRLGAEEKQYYVYYLKDYIGPSSL